MTEQVKKATWWDGLWVVVSIGAILAALSSWSWHRGYRAGTRDNADAIMCVLDRLGSQGEDKVRGSSEYCQRVNARRDAR